MYTIPHSLAFFLSWICYNSRRNASIDLAYPLPSIQLLNIIHFVPQILFIMPLLPHWHISPSRLPRLPRRILNQLRPRFHLTLALGLLVLGLSAQKSSGKFLERFFEMMRVDADHGHRSELFLSYFAIGFFDSIWTGSIIFLAYADAGEVGEVGV